MHIKFDFEKKVPRRKKNYIEISRLITRKLSKLFFISPPSITIYIFKNRLAFMKAIKKRRVPDWLIAYVPPNSKTDIYLNDVGEKRISREKLIRIFAHELTHLYINTCNPNLPDWVKEGIAVYMAKQIIYKKISRINWRKIAPFKVPFQGLSWRKATKYDGYNVAGLFISFLVKRYKWRNFLKSISSYKRGSSFFKTIANDFGEGEEKIIKDFQKSFVK